MTPPASLVPTAFSLAAVVSWGGSDFLGGFAARRTQALLFTWLVNLCGLAAVASAALAWHAVFPSRTQVGWAFAAGALGGSGLVLFYRALSTGNMGLNAPVAAVLSAAVPTVFSIVTEGFPGYGPMLGFLCAALGVWLIARSEQLSGRPEGLGLAVLAGLGFAGFYVCARQTGDASAIWVASCTRFSALVVTSFLLLARGEGKSVLTLSPPVWGLGAVTGLLDSMGTLAFVRASQTGRLDAAVVLSSLYPTVTVVLAGWFLKERFSRWRTIGILAALAAVPLIALH